MIEAVMARGRRGAPPPVALEQVYAARGPEGAPVLVLLHGTRRTRSMWRHQLAGLADAFRVVAVDLPAHGALAEVPFRLGDASALVSRVIDATAGGRAIVVGQSLGGYVGMDVAARRPDQVAGLVLANATTEPRSVAVRAPRAVGSYLLDATAERIRGAAVTSPRGAGGAARDGQGRVPAAVGGTPPGDAPDTATDPSNARAAATDPAPGDVPAAEPHDGPATSGWLMRGGTRAIVSALREVFLPRLAAYPGPTLIVNGEDDALFRHGERTFLAAAANGRLVVIPGCGHLVNEDQPEAFNAAVREFALEVVGATGATPLTPA